MAEPLVLVSTIGHIRHLQLNRAEKMNAANRQMLAELSFAYAKADKDPDVRVVLVSAVGDHFTAGLDLRDVLGAAIESGLALTPEGGIDPWGITTPPISKPVVVAVQGTCLTLGVELILASEISIASETAFFAQKEVSWGIMPFGGATSRFAQRTGWANAYKYLLTGEEFSASEALRIGMINEIVPTNKLISRAMSIAQLISENSPLAVQAILRSGRLSQTVDDQQWQKNLKEELELQLKSEEFKTKIANWLTN